jgi:two-component system OmpR family sensor kinase
MSSSRLVDRFHGLTLRTRLIGALVGLVALVCLIIGVGTELAVYDFQIKQVDQQIQNMRPRTTNFRDGAGDGAGRRDDCTNTRPPPGVNVNVIVDGPCGPHVVDSGNPAELKQLTPAQQAVVDAVPLGRPVTEHLDGLGDYRLVATTASGGDTVVTGVPLGPVYQIRNQVILIEIIVGLVALLVAGLAGQLIVRRTLRPLDRVAATAGRVTALPLDRGEVALSVRVPAKDTDPRTEVGQVGAALNRMLGHVAAALSARQASEMRVRHFVADASHELRTPLAAIRGYAELTRRGRDEVPPDVAHALRRVESEAARMTVLVEDLLLLARLDSGRPLETEPVDLSRLVIDAVSDAHVAGPDHRWQLDLPEESVAVAGDAARLHQVVANLLANGGTHTPPGTTVTTSLAVNDGHAVLSVVDDGPGIPGELMPELFERFARGDSSRSRQAGSTGLGLAIVAAVVEAHRGQVDVTSEPGRTAFTVRLPVDPGTKSAAPGRTVTSRERRDDRRIRP